MRVVNIPSVSALASASGSPLRNVGTCSGQQFNCRLDFAPLRLPEASLFQQPSVNSVSGSTLPSIQWAHSISKGLQSQCPSSRWVSLLNRSVLHLGRPMEEHRLAEVSRVGTMAHSYSGTHRQYPCFSPRRAPTYNPPGQQQLARCPRVRNRPTGTLKRDVPVVGSASPRYPLHRPPHACVSDPALFVVSALKTTWQE